MQFKHFVEDTFNNCNIGLEFALLILTNDPTKFLSRTTGQMLPR